MNKIFKIMFNVARGKMMVVNEATSAVQTGKKAAVTVVVLSSLLSGGAFANDSSITDDLTESIYLRGEINRSNNQMNYQEAPKVYALKDVNGSDLTISAGHLIMGDKDSKKLTVNYVAGTETDQFASKLLIMDSIISGDSYILGATEIKGYRQSTRFEATVKFYGSSVELDNVVAESSTVVGGGKINNAKQASLEVTNTEVVLNGEKTIVKSVVGGSYYADTYSRNAKEMKTNSSDIYIGKDVNVTESVVGGHYYDCFGTESSIKTTNIVIDGAN